ncbi:DinB family protein [Dactylosporangium sp. NPDC051541]|uniref:DinB family protein n=1 Tax=Dactylosporangium sp. NPDC051541 TaxID=3363977 RepID=UPI0037AD0212
MSNAFVQSLAHNFDQALRLLEAALTDCPDTLWATDLWPDEAPTAPAPHGGLHGSAPWFLGYHALTTLDYDLTGEFSRWAPPPPFDDNTYGFPNRAFTKPELLGYVERCRARVEQTLDGLTDEQAARPLPSIHRHHGLLYGVLVGGLPLHVVEHAAQIRQHLTAAGVKVRPMPGDRGYTG